MPKRFYSHGKLLISGEYLVLDGALSLALPSRFGQSLIVEEFKENLIQWTSIDNKGDYWFETTFKFINGKIELKDDDESQISKTLFKILTEAQKLNPKFLKTERGLKVTTTLEFPQDWGLGSSSTLINNIANWANVDAFKLLWNAFSGSGYDIACAQNDTPITYQLKNDIPHVEKTPFNPLFKDQLYFVHLNKKQNSREGIAHYKKYSGDKTKIINEVSDLTNSIIASKDLGAFEKLINVHEDLISSIIQRPKVKDLFFTDFPGSIKSLGAWGGDFILATGGENTLSYFKSKGYETVVSYNEMILNQK